MTRVGDLVDPETGKKIGTVYNDESSPLVSRSGSSDMTKEQTAFFTGLFISLGATGFAIWSGTCSHYIYKNGHGSTLCGSSLAADIVFCVIASLVACVALFSGVYFAEKK